MRKLFSAMMLFGLALYLTGCAEGSRAESTAAPEAEISAEPARQVKETKGSAEGDESVGGPYTEKTTIREDNFMKNWLITGCSTGLGRSLARAALERGFHVAMPGGNSAAGQIFGKDQSDYSL